jgi:hypothetical protein
MLLLEEKKLAQEDAALDRELHIEEKKLEQKEEEAEAAREEAALDQVLMI